MASTEVPQAPSHGVEPPKRRAPPRLVAHVSEQEAADARWYSDVLGTDLTKLMRLVSVNELVSQARALRRRLDGDVPTDRSEHLIVVSEELRRLAAIVRPA